MSIHSWKDLESSICITESIPCRGITETYKAVHKESGKIVIVKKTMRFEKDMESRDEWDTLKKCDSRFTVGYIDFINTEDEQCVGFCNGRESVDPDGVLRSRIIERMLPKEIQSGGGRTTRDRQLLPIRAKLSSFQFHYAWSG